MYHIFDAMKNRMEELLMPSANLIFDASTGDNVLKVDDASDFNWQGFYAQYPEVAIMDNNSSGRLLPGGGYQGIDIHNLANAYSNSIVLDSNVEQNWLVSDNAKVRRSPAGQIVKQVKVGDLAVIQKFPTICVVPDSKAKEWYTLSGTMENISIDFIVYAAEGETEEATLAQLKLADVVEYILDSNLHIAPTGAVEPYQVTSRAICRRIKYGTIEKQSQFIKAAQLTWEADMYIWRGYLTKQGEIEAPVQGPWDREPPYLKATS